MSRDPIAYDRGELADLHCQSPIFPRCNAQCIFVEPNLSAVIARVKTAIEPGLREEINLRADLRIQKKSQTRIEKSVDAAVDETGRRLIEVIDFQIERAAQSCAQFILKCGDRKLGIEPVEEIINIESVRRAGKNAQADGAQLHATALIPFAARKSTSNSVQSFSERTRRKLPPCSRASSRARFNPMP